MCLLDEAPIAKKRAKQVTNISYILHKRYKWSIKKVALKINIKVSRIQCNILMTLQNEILSYAAIPNQFFNYVIFTGLAFS